MAEWISVKDRLQKRPPSCTDGNGLELITVAEDIIDGKDYGCVMDINGNKVGEWELR